jgi:hypothetical protein
LRKERRTEMTMPVSIVSRKTMKKMGTAKAFGMVPATGRPDLVLGRCNWGTVGYLMRI